MAGDIWASGGRELDLKEVCKRVCEELFVVFHHGFLKFRKNL
jgi:hypothetical protein